MKGSFPYRFLFVSLILLLGCLQLFAQQSGTIRGKVLDQSTGDPLIGANVVVLGTSLGAATDINGDFSLTYVPSGKQTLRVSYIGYEPITVEVVVEGGRTLQQEFRLVPQAIMGEEIVVTAQARGQQAAINQQLTANTIKNVVAAEKIRELPDESAAAALSRLPGVSIQDGDKVVLRGIQAKQNVILMNGVQLPSTDMNDRSVNLGFISSNMLSGIEVFKVLTPDMDANAIGGVVNLKLMEAPEGFKFDVLTQGMYNLQDRTTDNYKAWISASNRFFDNAFGVFVQGNINRLNTGNDQTNAGYARQGNTDIYRMNTFTFTDQENIVTNRGGSITLDYVFPRGKVVLQNSLNHNINDFTNYRRVLDFAQTLGTFSIFRDKHNRELIINSLYSEYNFGPFKTELTLSHSFSDKNTDIRYGDPGQNFGFSDNYPFGIVGYTSSGNPIAKQYAAERDYFTPDDVYKLQLDDSSIYRAKMDGWAVTRAEAFKQHLYTAKLDFLVPVVLMTGLSTDIKFGGKFDRTTRENDIERTYHRVGDNDMYDGVKDFLGYRQLDNLHPLLFYEIRNPNYKRGKYFLDDSYRFYDVVDRDRMDKFMPAAVKGWRLSRHKSSSERGDFNGSEIFTAGYMMGTFKIGPRLTIIGGARYEQYEMDYKAKFVVVTHSVDGLCLLFDTLNTVKRVDRNWFPNAQLQYKVTDWSDIRLAYTKTIARPDYNAIIPNIYYSPGEEAQAGNPNLKPTVSTNYDASVYLYNNEIGLFALTGFYKKLENTFYSTQIYYKNLHYFNAKFVDTAALRTLGVSDFLEPQELVTTYLNNPRPGYLRGFEVEWQTNFWYLPKPFNSLVLNINYTRTWSSMEYTRIINRESVYTRPPSPIRYREFISKDTVYKSKLLQQGDHIINIVLGFDYKDFSARLSYNLQDAVNSYIGNVETDDQFTGKIHRWDLTLQQKLPIEGVSIAFNGINMFRKPIKTYQRFRRPGAAQLNENLVTTIYTPSFYELSLRYSL